jgi:exodeoxyribonuclease V alpha subunit
MGIFNGDIGTIKSIDTKHKTLVIRFDDRTAVYDREQAMDIELSYATTIHKSQGNEFEAVIIPLFSTPQPLRYRNLIYTGVTRAKKLLILAGDSSILAQMVHNHKNILRYTGLKYFMANGHL